MGMLGQKIREFIFSQSGATAIEYGLIAGMMAVAAIVSFATLSNGLQNLFGATSQGAGSVIENAASSADLN